MRVLISGASIAGLTLAHWLARHGFQPTVVERAPGLRAGGNGVDLRDGAVEVVERMGLMPAVRAAATDVRGIKFVDADDRAIARLDLAGASEVEIMRGDLVALLHRATDVEYLFGDTIRSLKQDGPAEDGGVTVEFEHAARRRFDLVVGADGLHSTVRRLAFGDESRYLRHRGHYFAFADADAALGEDRWVTMFNVPGKMAGIYRSGNHAQAKAYFVFRSGPLAYDHRDVGQHKRLLSEAFAGESSWHVRELLAGALADPELYFDALSQVRMDSWSAGRVALVGDAAWCASPASGAGAELALVGAHRLATELAAEFATGSATELGIGREPAGQLGVEGGFDGRPGAGGGDYAAAFARYHAGHRGLVRRRQRIGPNVRLMVPKTAAGRLARDTFARLMGTGRAVARRATCERSSASS